MKLNIWAMTLVLVASSISFAGNIESCTSKISKLTGAVNPRAYCECRDKAPGVVHSGIDKVPMKFNVMSDDLQFSVVQVLFTYNGKDGIEMIGKASFDVLNNCSLIESRALNLITKN